MVSLRKLAIYTCLGALAGAKVSVWLVLLVVMSGWGLGHDDMISRMILDRAVFLFSFFSPSRT